MMSFDERIKNLTEIVGNQDEVARVQKFVGSVPWKFAKTYADFCPHEYILRQNMYDRTEYNNLIHHIWLYGIDGYYGKKTEPNRYWFNHSDGYYYFIFPEDTDEEGNPTSQAYIINRAKISEFKFWIDDSAEGKRVKCVFKFWEKKDK